MIKVTPHHLTLRELIIRLEAYPYPDKLIPIGFCQADSYRGNYNEVAFYIKENTTPRIMLECAKRAMNATFSGYKGGEFTMGKYTPCWLVEGYGDFGESLGALLLDLLLSLPSNG